MFKGGRVPDQLKHLDTKWGDYVRIYLFCANRETGTVATSPLDIMEWPYRFFIILKIIQAEFVAHIHKSQKDVAKKAKNKRRPRRV
ncbi:MAG: hypothetical protein K9K80_02045 [Spirochaetia bacterium]|nr:hypothetical protein [Spirochaetia bacterium]